MKRLASIQDISCIGKCSLTAALPVISAAGVEAAVMPTALLSTHTAFNNFTFLDLTDEIKKIAYHWKKEKFEFDCIYTGYLGSVRQIDIVSEIIDDIKCDKTLIVTDPVMGDNGKLYSGFSCKYAEKMKSFCRSADIIMPNLTEAALLTDTEYKTYYTESEIRELLIRLSDVSEGRVVLTGISPSEKKLGIAAYNPFTNNIFSYYGKKSDMVCHGAGDLFASAFCGGVLNDFSENDALKIAVDFVIKCIEFTVNDENSVWYGLNFEKALPYYIKELGI